MNRLLDVGLRVSVITGSALFLTAAVARANGCGQTAKLLAGDGVSNDAFGETVGISGTTAVVGSYANNSYTGAVYVFDTTSGLELHKLVASDGGSFDQLGGSLAISGTTAISGAVGADADRGAAYLFDTVTGQELAKLSANDALFLDNFGYSCAISGTTALVGANHDDDNGGSSGSAYLFDTTTGLQTAKLVPDDGAASDLFGFSVAISGRIAIVGAIWDDDNGSNSGSAYLFDTTTGQQIAKLLPGDGATNEYFGYSVSISGAVAIVGAPAYQVPTSSGAAYLFDVTTGQELAKLLPGDASAGDTFGISVAISGSTAIVGADGDDDAGVDSGSAYVFDVTTGQQLAKLGASDGDASDRFGYSAAISGSSVIFGAYGDADSGPRTGSAYLFDVATPVPLVGDVASISLSAGGSQALTLDGGCGRAGWSYFLLGSATGTDPGLDFGGGVVLPLNLDGYFFLTLNKPSLLVFSGYRGTLDASGRAVASFSIPPGSTPTLSGVTLNHAYLAAEVLGVVDYASDAVPVSLVP